MADLSRTVSVWSISESYTQTFYVSRVKDMLSVLPISENLHECHRFSVTKIAKAHNGHQTEKNEPSRVPIGHTVPPVFVLAITETNQNKKDSIHMHDVSAFSESTFRE